LFVVSEKRGKIGEKNEKDERAVGDRSEKGEYE
jgi:hypothetical protein